MKSFLFLTLLVLTGFYQEVSAQSATVSLPVSLGRNNCGGGGGKDSLYYYNYTSPNLSNSISPIGCFPKLKPKGFSIFLSGISFNPADGMLYYQQVDLSTNPWTTYIWKWSPYACPLAALDTLRTFKSAVIGLTFDANGIAWQMDFSAAINPLTGSLDAYLSTVDFATGVLGPKDTMNLTGGSKIYSANSGDITMTPSGQMYFAIDNKLFTPDYKSYGGPTGHITCTYIDTVKKPAGASSLVGIAYADGDLITSYSTGCKYARVDPITGDTAGVSYTYPAGKGIYAVDMTQINSGIGSAKKLISLTATGTPNQYDVVYDVYVKNYGNVPLTNVQVTDNLTSINGAANVSNVTATFTSNPAGVSLDPSYNGNSNINLLAAGQNVSNYPVSNNNFTIRISCRLSNIQSGVIYNNLAIATANGFNSVALRDSSTNGPTPDLNQNDKPDDLGESQPTPLLIALAAVTPPCAAISNPLYTQNFGSGIGLTKTLGAPIAGTGVFFATAATSYTGVLTQPIPDETYTVTNNANNADNANFIGLTDHTGNANGRMLVINADAASTKMYRGTFFASTCANQQYSLSFYAAFIGNSSYQTLCNGFGGFKYPQIKMRILDGATGLVITQISTPNITATSWQQYGLKFTSPASYGSIIIELINDAPGGCGNDIAIDDIQYGTCDALPVINIVVPSGGCLGGSTTFTSSLSDPSAIPGAKNYQWQVSADSIIWANIPGATSSTYIINPVTGLNTGKYYRVIVAAAGNIGSPNCQYTSPGYLLISKTPSVDPTSASRNKNNVCPLNLVTLSVVGGSLGTNASWKWYSGSCGGALIGSGTTIIVSPSVTTTYYVRAEGDCNNTICQAVTIFISCNIDKDKDGIPDFVESNMAAAFADADGDGIKNAYDIDYAGFVDNNGDFINDNFEADGDSDNDGIPNYLDIDFPGRVDTNGDGIDDRFDADKDGIINMLDLDSDNDGIPDVVEAGGVDANGDGKIDNYSDTDGDGLSQNVDTNNSGAYNSGFGLGLPDLDGDGVPNFIDLDSDNDGIPDVREVGGADANNDGKIDGFVDANSDGISDNIILLNALLKTGADINNDGKADSYPFKNMDKDSRANPYDVDSDGDGIVDVIEAGLPDANLDGFVDGVIGTNGWSTTISSMGLLTLRNTDADPNPDYLDIDSDNDGITDNIEGPSTLGYFLPSGIDTDKDGLDDAYDNTPSFGGHGIFVIDKDGDGTPDYRDLDTDGDGYLDIKEGNDWNFNGIADEIVTLTNVDTDGDGLDDRFDLDNTSAKVTSKNIGNGGSTAGDPSPGTRAVVQKTPALAGDRDWRWVTFVLPIEFAKFSGAPKNNKTVQLSWSVMVASEVDKFEIYRSTDNQNFTLNGTLSTTVRPNELQTFYLLNDISDLNTDMVFYRLHVIGKNGELTISNVIVVKLNNTKSLVTLMPNPATDNTVLKIRSDKESIATIRLIDNTGIIILVKQIRVYKGKNLIQMSDLGKYGSGVYNVQVLLNDEILNTKLGIMK
ncbi:MAG TPA: hypothetical protein VGP55_13420 [Chitinophagaceae bacterium]|nr:hypothetical protein [Chitinophagaceae bacterium]